MAAPSTSIQATDESAGLDRILSYLGGGGNREKNVSLDKNA